MSSRVRVGHVLVIPLLGRAGLHGDVDVTRVRARWNGGVVQRVNGSMGGARLAAEMALQPLGRFEFPRLVFLLEIQRFPRQHVLTSREILSWEAWESERIRISESLFIYLSKKKKKKILECLWKRVVRMAMGDGGVQSPIRSPSVVSAT